MNAHLNKLKIATTDMCPCNTEPMNTEHLLQRCPSHATLRNQIWPHPTELRRQLYGTLEDLQRTANFVRRAGVTI